MTEHLKKRQQLAKLMEFYLECLIEKTPEKLPVAPDYRATYNGADIQAGENEVWKNTLVIQKRQTFLDAESGEIVFLGVCSNEVVDRQEYFRIEEYSEFKSYLISIRLKVTDGQISEIEELAKTGRSRYFYCLPEEMQLPDLLFETCVPEEERCSRSELIEQVDCYWKGFFGGYPQEIINIHPDCQRIENGYQTTNHSASVRGDCKWNPVFTGKSNVHISTPEPYIFYPVVDPIRGIVVSYATMVTEVENGPRFASRICEVFLIRDGCIKRILAMFPPVENDGGWEH